MRIDHSPLQLAPPNNPPHRTTGGVGQGVGNHVMSPNQSNYRLLQAESEASPNTSRDICPMLVGSKVDGFERKGQAWFVATELQSDLVVEVGEMSFHLHKFPLLSRSGKLNRLVFDSRDAENSHIKLNDMPGGPETFELAAKFCYGVAVELTSANVAALRCAAEYLEMTEDLDEGNLVCKTEAFLTFVVLASWKDSITVLRGCEKLLPWADQLQIVRRCCESIAWKACTDPRGIRWSFTQRQDIKKPILASPLWNGPKNQLQGGPAVSDPVPRDWWLEDISVVCAHFFTKIIQAIKAKGMRDDLIGSAVVHYAIKWLPGLSRELGVMEVKDSKDTVSVDGNSQAAAEEHLPQPLVAVTDKENGRANDVASVQMRNRDLIESLAVLIPPQKDAAPCTFLLRLLRLAKMVGGNPVVISDLEKRAGLQLDQGTLSDLLIPSFDHTCDTLFDIDLVQRMLDYFLLQEFISPPGTLSPVDSEREKLGLKSTADKGHIESHSTYPAKMRVAKLIDNYLVEVGRDQNLTLNKFLTLAEALPENTRVTDDGLYKAIDTYLKAHPDLTEYERKKLCRSLDCQRLSLDACMHAAQNERLPLRMVVQVLFGEQIKLRNAVSGTSSVSKDQSDAYSGEDDRMSIGGSSHDSVLHEHEHDHEHSEEEIKVLRSDVERMKGKFVALQHDYTAIQLQLEKLTKNPKSQSSVSGWKKIFPRPHLPHPHFHVPHFLSHPMELFHHKDHNHHHGKESGFRHGAQAPEKGQVHLDIQQVYPSKTYESVRRSEDHDESKLLQTHPSQHSREHPSHHLNKEGHRKGQFSSNESRQDRQLPLGDSSSNSLHTKLSSVSPQSKENEYFHTSKDRSRPLNDPCSKHSAAGRYVHSLPADPRFSKDSDSYHSGSHADSGEDSSRSLEGPATPTHTLEHKKHARPFANAIRKWRNSIS